MEYLVTGKQAALIDRYSIDEVGMPSLVLMERASLCVAGRVEELAGAGRKTKILSICGSGNNGGDGMAASRILYVRGYDARILLIGNKEKLSDDARTQLNIAVNTGMSVEYGKDIAGSEDKPDMEKMVSYLRGYDIIIDAVFGTGLSREVGGRYRDWVEAVNASSQAGTKICAVDIASGIDSASGKVLGTAVKADITVTFGYRKLGHVLYPGALYSGKTYCHDIGFAPEAVKKCAHPVYETYTDRDLSEKNVMPERRPDSNKGTYGRALIIAGSRNMAGAAYFSSKAAYLAGAGLVSIYTPECNRSILQQLIPEAVIKTYEEEAPDKSVISELLRSHTVAVLGPGLGTGEASEAIVKQALGEAEIPLVIDADALNIISKHIEWLRRSRARIVITPHLKELSRLTGYNIQTLKSNMQNICADFIRENGVICISKDARTMIFEENQYIYVNLSGNNGMSTGGSGDVLTGIIAGLIAQGKDPGEASRLGVFIHGRAGDLAAKERGFYSVTASDILVFLPQYLRGVSQTVSGGID